MTLDELVTLWLSVWVPERRDATALDRAGTFSKQLYAWAGDSPERLAAFDRLSGDHVTEWVLNLGFELAAAGRVDDAVANCERFAPLGNAQVFLGDRVEILSEAGRHAEATVAANELLEQFPDDAWGHIFAADAFRAAGDDARAEAGYRRALELDPTDPHTVEGVLERWIPWLEDLNRTAEAQRVVDLARSRLR